MSSHKNHSDLHSRTLPRNYNNTSISQQMAPLVKPAGHLEYFDLDHSNPPPICQNASASSMNHLNSTTAHHQHSHHGGRGVPTRSVTDLSNIFQKPIGESSGIVYKSVDFVKTEAIKRTRQDTELNRAKHLFKD